MIAAIGAPPVSLERDMDRIEGMRARNVARTNRFLNARLRTIGLDTDALDEQMREQRAREMREEMAAKDEFDRNENVYRQVALQEAEERRLRDEELERMRLDWLEQMRFKKDKEQREKHLIHAGVDFDSCGASSVQKMAGEDPNKASRVSQQRAQMREWSTQQSNERLARKEAADEDMAAYWAYLKRVNDKQGELTEEEEAARKAVGYTIKEENRRMAAQKVEEMERWKEQEDRANAEELRFRGEFLREDEGDEDAPPRQSFKGMSRKQKAELFKTNVDMRAAAARKVQLEREEAAAWHVQQERMRLAMEEADREERRKVKEAEAEVLRDLQEQQLQLQQRNMRERNSRFGDIDYTHGIYAGFGKSCR